MLARTSAFLIWAAVAGAAVFWALRLFGTSPQAPLHAQGAPVAAVVRADLGRVLGPDPAPVAATPQTPVASADQARFQLVGVIAAGPAGWATIAVDGKPPRTYRVGSVVDGASVLQKVAPRGVEIGPRGLAPTVLLQLSPMAPAATGRPGTTVGAAVPVSAGLPMPPAMPPAAPTVMSSTAPGAAAPPQAPDGNGASAALRRPGVVTR
jgi:general secretion pathway protein C